MRMGQGVRTGLGHGGITCVLQTQFSSLILSYIHKCVNPHKNKTGTWISQDILLEFFYFCHTFISVLIHTKIKQEPGYHRIYYWDFFYFLSYIHTCVYPHKNKI